ncbi:MAG: hypothetical protein QJR13_05675, partial [Bacillota bacterium]|nr:hypothetical protein [Bacillota bacterium]
PQVETDVKPGLRYQREFRPGFTGGVDLGATVGNRADGWKVCSVQESGQLRGRLPRDWVLDLTLTHHGTLAQTGQWLQAATAGASVSRVLRTGASASLSYRWGVSASSEEGRSQEAALRWAEPWWIGTYFAEARWSQRSKSSDPLYTREWWWVSTGMRIAF